MRIVIFSLNMWETQYEIMLSDFLVTFPDTDPQLCIAALRYIRDHQDEMQASLETGKVDIHVADVERFGLRNRMKETLREKGVGDGPGINFILDPRVAN